MSVSETYAKMFCGEAGASDAVRVEWRADGALLSEETHLVDFDTRGAAFTLEKQPEVGQLLKLSRLSVGQTSQAMWALVWALAPAPASPDKREASSTSRHLAHVLFCGSDVPRNFVESQSETYRYFVEEDMRLKLQRSDASASGAEKRRESRLNLPYVVMLQVPDVNGEIATTEFGVTENVSAGGAALRANLSLPVGARLKVLCEQINVSLEAVVRASRMGDDKVNRLHLEFLNGRWPL